MGRLPACLEFAPPQRAMSVRPGLIADRRRTGSVLFPIRLPSDAATSAVLSRWFEIIHDGGNLLDIQKVMPIKIATHGIIFRSELVS